LNHNRIARVVCVPLTSDLRWAGAPGNVRLTAAATGLPDAKLDLVLAGDRHRARPLSASASDVRYSPARGRFTRGSGDT